MVAFGSWEMPLAYPGGTLAEHHRCRTDAVAFDVSHLGTVRVGGTGAVDRLQYALSNDLGRIGPGRAQYSLSLDEDGSVIDDMILWWLGGEDILVMPNASNTERVLAAVGGRDETSERAVVAVQGPRSRAVAEAALPGAAGVGRFRVGTVSWRGSEVTVAGTGYTGEDGLELAVPVERAEELWSALGEAGAAPAGLGARDTLRLEAGLALHGHELGPGITPLQAGLGWVVAWDKGEFRGRTALESERESGVSRLLRGIVLDGRQPPRDGCAVRAAGDEVGVVTSGNFSPCLGRGIALGFMAPGMAPGDAVEVDVRSRLLPGRVAATPFVAGAPPVKTPRAATDGQHRL